MQQGVYFTSDTSCKICLQTQMRVISERDRRGKELTTAICTSCGLISSHPLPTLEQLHSYYKLHYRTDYKGVIQPKRKHILRYSRGAVSRIRKFADLLPKGSKLLDVGSGSGEFAYLAKLAGYDTMGLEPHMGYASYSESTFGFRVINAPLEQAEISPSSLDIITMHHVLEHLQYPLTSLTILNRWLKPGGLLAIDVPDIARLRHAPARRFHFAHIYNFNGPTLAAMSSKAGFEIVRGERETSIVARKIGAPEPEKPICMTENYQMLWDLLSSCGTREHYSKRTPYTRIANKIVRYPAEYITAQMWRNPREIVERELKRM